MIILELFLELVLFAGIRFLLRIQKKELSTYLRELRLVIPVFLSIAISLCLLLLDLLNSILRRLLSSLPMQGIWSLRLNSILMRFIFLLVVLLEGTLMYLIRSFPRLKAILLFLVLLMNSISFLTKVSSSIILMQV